MKIGPGMPIAYFVRVKISWVRRFMASRCMSPHPRFVMPMLTMVSFVKAPPHRVKPWCIWRRMTACYMPSLPLAGKSVGRLFPLLPYLSCGAWLTLLGPTDFAICWMAHRSRQTFVRQRPLPLVMPASGAPCWWADSVSQGVSTMRSILPTRSDPPCYGCLIPAKI